MNKAIPKDVSMGSIPEKHKQDQINEGEEILRNLQAAIQAQATHETTIQGHVQIQIDRSRARLAAGNTVGAALSFKKYKKFQEEMQRVAEAIDYLETLEAELALILQQRQLQKTILVTSTLTIDLDEDLGDDEMVHDDEHDSHDKKSTPETISHEGDESITSRPSLNPFDDDHIREVHPSSHTSAPEKQDFSKYRQAAKHVQEILQGPADEGEKTEPSDEALLEELKQLIAAA